MNRAENLNCSSKTSGYLQVREGYLRQTATLIGSHEHSDDRNPSSTPGSFPIWVSHCAKLHQPCNVNGHISSGSTWYSIRPLYLILYLYISTNSTSYNRNVIHMTSFLTPSKPFRQTLTWLNKITQHNNTKSKEKLNKQLVTWKKHTMNYP